MNDEEKSGHNETETARRAEDSNVSPHSIAASRRRRINASTHRHISASSQRRAASILRSSSLFLLIAFTLAVACVYAQVSPTAEGRQDEDEDEVVRVTTSEVLLPVTVRDAGGRLVSTLKREDFRVWEDGREQPLSDLALRQVPVDVALMVDASSSVAANLDDFRRAVEEFAVRLAPDDRVSLIKFDDRVELLLDWTASRMQLRRALRRVTPGMFTRFNDALYLAAREQFRAGAKRHAVVVLTDGIDSGRGHATLDTSLRALLEAQATLYVISNTEIERARKQAELDTLLGASPSALKFNQLRIGDLRESLRVLDISERNLAELTNATGGRLYKPLSFDSLDSVYAEVADELRHQYALYYTPLDRTRDGKFRRVRVATADRNMRPTTRLGYFAPRN
ncbi:MAG TPA: VWA domain-containing protein [Pyrinomonadaceae bacterium]|nr:VWA domain-containing protein [Pyrinomonadaceae bacterium]